MKKILSFLLTFLMIFSIVPLNSLAEDESISVTLTFDASVVAEDMDKLYSDLLSSYIIDEETTNLPSDITITVPKGSTVQEILRLAQEKYGFTAVGIDDDFVTEIGYVGKNVLENLVSISVGDYYSGNVFNSAGWSFYVNDERLTSSVANSTVTENGAVVKGIYGLAKGWDSDWNIIEYDEIFLRNYNKLKELTHKDIDTDSFTEKQKQKLASEMEEAELLLNEIYEEASLNEDVCEALAEIYPAFKISGGIWIGYIEKKGISFWGTGSPIEKLETAVKEMESAMNPLPDNLISELYVTNLFGTAEDNLISDFASDKYEYVIKDYTKDNFLSKFIKWKSVASSEDANVSVSVNGESVAEKDLTDGWKQYDGLNWEDGVLTTLTFTVIPPEESVLSETVYTVKIFSEITDEKKISLAKKVLDFDYIKGLNNGPREITTSLNLPSKIEIEDVGQVSVSWTGFDGEFLGEKGELLSRPESAKEVNLLATLASGETSDVCSFDIIILPPSEKEYRDRKISELLESIAKIYTDKNSYWEVMDLGAYNKHSPEADAVLSAEAMQSFINTSIKLVTESDADTELAKAILALISQGKDATRLYTVNSNTPIDAVKKLNNSDLSTSVWSVPYTLAVYNRDEYKNREKELFLIDALLESQEGNGAWDEYGTIDTTANAIAGLSFYLNDEDTELADRVNKAIERALMYLSSQQNEDGSFSDTWSGRNSNSTSMVAIALAAAGVNAEEDTRFIKRGNSIIDGLLSFALKDNTGFGHTDNITLSDYSTEQSFRALIALAGAIKSGSSHNIYDFNGISLSFARATDEYAGGGRPSEPQGDEISVEFTIKADNGYWLNTYTVVLPGNGATVYHAFIKGCNENNIKFEGTDKGYVSSISKGNKTLSEFSDGKNSGWLYKLNGEAPAVGIRECNIKNGDTIEFFYTKDYTKESSLRRWRGSKEEKKEEDTPKNVFTEDVFSDVNKDNWYYESVKYVYESNLMQGTEKGFEPEEKMSRAMLVTIMYRVANSKVIENAHSFTDVPESIWYRDAVSWALQNKIVSGTGDGKFSPDGDVSREQVAVILYRFAKTQGYDIKDGDDTLTFDDTADVSDWAIDAIKWAYKEGLISGTTETTLSPKGTLTRAELATILMRFCKNTQE